MGLISMDFQSVVIGYAIGIALMWSLNELLYGDNNDEERTEKDSKNTRPRYDRRYNMLHGDTPE
tara:strand:- start:37 stop:228 length:192 start_codon:yes stop_codon:yes gene_type:complete